jgi:hypothetical protein
MYQVTTVVRAALTVGVKAETSVQWVIVFPLSPDLVSRGATSITSNLIYDGKNPIRKQFAENLLQRLSVSLATIAALLHRSHIFTGETKGRLKSSL